MSSGTTTRPPVRWGARSVAELIGELADALAWPRNRPARVLLGERAETVSACALCTSERAVADVADQKVATLLAVPAPSALVRRGRRSYDEFALRPTGSDDDPTSWRTQRRVILDGAEMLAGGMRGFDEMLARELGMSGARVFAPVAANNLKFVGFVPVEALDRVRSAVFQAGAGVIGDYRECSWSSEGTGTFRGGAETHPAIGSPGAFEQAAEARFEVVCPAEAVTAVAAAFADAMPYEEPAYDVYPLATPARVGAGRVGALPAGGASAMVELLRSLVGTVEVREPSTGADVVALRGATSPAPASHSGGTAALPARGTCVVTSQPLASVLPDVIRVANAAAADGASDAGIAFIVCAGATDAERALCRERGLALAVVDRERLVRRLSEPLAAHLSRRLGVKIQVHGGLDFPVVESGEHTGQLTAVGDDDDRRVVALRPNDAARPRQLWFDGGSRGNPGPAASAFLLYDAAGAEVYKHGVSLGTATNNVAEYSALIAGLRAALERGATDLEIFSDSELVVKQLQGKYKVKNEAMKSLHAQSMELLGQLGSYSLSHVLRARNAAADALVNQTLDNLR